MKASTWLAALAVIGGIGWTLVAHGPLGRRAEVAAGYAARVVCSCRYVGGRGLASCRTDLEPGMELVRLTDDPGARRVSAWVPLLPRARASAVADGDLGCRLEARERD